MFLQKDYAIKLTATPNKFNLTKVLEISHSAAKA
jgi:hypothetical protein